MESAPNGRAAVHHNSESSLVVKVKSKKHLDIALMELKDSVLGNLNESFYLWGGCCVKVPREIVCSRCRWVEGLDLIRSTWDIAEFVAKCPNGK